MAKSPDAFRTISEVADWLGIQAHVLRFWESKFTQVKPIKRAGGRRYYRPADMQLLGGIKKLLHDDGLTIKGVQKLLREEGMNHVSALSPPLDEETQAELTPKAAPVAPLPIIEAEEEKGVVLTFEAPVVEEPIEEEPEVTAPEDADAPEVEGEIEKTHNPVFSHSSFDRPVVPDTSPDPEAATAESESMSNASEPVETIAEDLDETVSASPDTSPESEPAPTIPDADEEVSTDPEPASALPAFLRRPLSDADAPEAAEPEPIAAEPEETTPEPEPVAPPAPTPRVIDMPTFTPEADFTAAPASLSAAYKARALSADRAAMAEPLLKQLTALRDSMAARRRNPPGPNT